MALAQTGRPDGDERGRGRPTVRLIGAKRPSGSAWRCMLHSSRRQLSFKLRTVGCHELSSRSLNAVYKWCARTYLLWRNVKRHCSKVHFLVRVYAGHDEEQSGSLGAARSESTQSEDDGSLVLLNDLQERGRLLIRKERNKFGYWYMASGARAHRPCREN